MDKLLNGTLNGEHNNNHPKTFCPRCLTGFDLRYEGEKKLAEHKVECQKGNPCVVVIYPEVKYIGFEKVRDFHPMVCYADFESALKTQLESEKLENHLNLNIENCHEMTGYSITTTFRKNLEEKLDAVEDEPLKSKQYTGENAVQHFVRTWLHIGARQ